MSSEGENKTGEDTPKMSDDKKRGKFKPNFSKARTSISFFL